MVRLIARELLHGTDPLGAINWSFNGSMASGNGRGNFKFLLLRTVLDLHMQESAVSL